MFKMRTSKPGAGNKCYITTSKGGWSWCIQGSPTDSACNVLSNCVGYACGRFNEIYNEIKGTTGMKYYALNCNAERFAEKAKSFHGLEVVSYPVKGGIMVWEGAGNLAGHVAIVEEVYDNNHVYTSESGWNSSAFWNAHRYNTNGRWGSGTSYKFIGCVVNPAVGKVTAAPKPTPAPSTSTKFNVGSKIVLNGYLYRDSRGNGRGAMKINYKGTVTIVCKGAAKPYHIDKLGWVAEGDIISQGSSSVVYYPKCSSKYTSIVDALRSIGVDSSYSNRSKIASVNGISGYAGTASQNIKMLDLLKQGKLIKSK